MVRVQSQTPAASVSDGYGDPFGGIYSSQKAQSGGITSPPFPALSPGYCVERGI